MKIKKLGLLFLALPFLFGFTNIAHRGDNELGKYAEHSFEAYDHAAVEGANYLELDLQETKDGVLVVSHDDNLSRVFGVDKSIPRSKYADLIDYQNQSGEPIHSLKEIFQRYQADPSLKFMIETRVNDGASMEKPLVNLIKQYHLNNRVLLESFSLDSLKKLAKIAPDIPRTQLGGDYREIGDNQYYASGLYSHEAANYLKDHGKKYLLWGVNSDRAMKLYQTNHHVDGILTDYPNHLAKVDPQNQWGSVFNDKNLAPKKIQGQLYVKSFENCPVSVYKGYGDHRQYSGVRLKADTLRQFTKIASENGNLWYCLGDDLWINGDFVKYDKGAVAIAPHMKNGLVMTVKTTPIYGDANCEDSAGRQLRDNSQWHYFAVYKNADHSAYNLGGNQWIKAQDVKIVKQKCD